MTILFLNIYMLGNTMYIVCYVEMGNSCTLKYLTLDYYWRASQESICLEVKVLFFGTKIKTIRNKPKILFDIGIDSSHYKL